jgi:hypothetical protein
MSNSNSDTGSQILTITSPFPEGFFFRRKQWSSGTIEIGCQEIPFWRLRSSRPRWYPKCLNLEQRNATNSAWLEQVRSKSARLPHSRYQPMIPFSRREEETSNKQEQPGMQFTHKCCKTSHLGGLSQPCLSKLGLSYGVLPKHKRYKASL